MGARKASGLALSLLLAATAGVAMPGIGRTAAAGDRQLVQGPVLKFSGHGQRRSTAPRATAPAPNRVAAAPSASALTCDGSWQAVAAPGGSGDAQLVSIGGTARNDLWSVGWARATAGQGPGRTLAEHWDGSTWNVVATPNASTTGNILTAVSAASATDVWAVGGYVPYVGAPSQTLVENLPAPNGKVASGSGLGADGGAESRPDETSTDRMGDRPLLGALIPSGGQESRSRTTSP